MEMEQNIQEQVQELLDFVNKDFFYLAEGELKPCPLAYYDHFHGVKDIGTLVRMFKAGVLYPTSLSARLVYIHLRTAFKARALCRLVQKAEAEK